MFRGKDDQKTFPTKGNKTNALLELVYTDVCGPINIRATGGYEYFITFIDVHSRYGYVYIMQHKSEAFEKFKEFRAKVKKQLDTHIKVVRSDQCGEYLSNEFIDHLVQNRILSQLTAPGTPQQNGVAKRKNQNLLDMTRSMMSYSDLSLFLWGYAMEITMYILMCVDQ